MTDVPTESATTPSHRLHRLAAVRGGLALLGMLFAGNALDLYVRCSLPTETRSGHGTFVMLTQAGVCGILLMLLVGMVWTALRGPNQCLSSHTSLPKHLPKLARGRAPYIERN